MFFREAIEQIRILLHSVGSDIDSGAYDGLIVKTLHSSNTLYSSSQTHIAITGEQMNCFPYFRSDGYFCDTPDSILKKFFVLQAPVFLYESNIKYLNSGNIPNQMAFKDGILKTKTSFVRNRRKDAPEQIQISLINSDGPDFICFRKLLYPDSALIMLKRKGQFEYDAFGLLPNYICPDNIKWRDLDGYFFKADNITPVEITESSSRIQGGSNILLYGVPGSGKSWTIETEYCADENYIKRVVFHPDYSYSDFVGQIMPKLEGGKVIYKYVMGPFTEIMQLAQNDQYHEYFLVIEELNRGNAPAIFGDIFQLLDRNEEPGKRDIGESKFGITNNEIAEKVYGDANRMVRIPSNLTILATMNTSDQNVFTLDTAFQRRWIMRHIDNDVRTYNHAKDKIAGSQICWGAFVEVINDEVINANDGLASAEDKRLGAFFATTSDMVANRFPEKVIKYLWDDAFRLNRDQVFISRLKTLDQVIQEFKNCVDSDDKDSIGAVIKDSVFNEMISLTNEILGISNTKAYLAAPIINGTNGESNV